MISFKKGQLSIFLIVVLMFLGIVALYFILRDQSPSVEEIPSDHLPLYTYYQSCIEEKARAAIDLASTQGGQVYIEEYSPGSEYAPFSSQLNFLGFPVPYWSYLSNHGVIKEQVPSQEEIETDIARYINEKIATCNFNHFYQRGYLLHFGSPTTSVSIRDTQVEVDVQETMTVAKDNISSRKTVHRAVVSSKLGTFYTLARQLYEKEKKEAFLENYSIDVLRLYAPVDGVDTSCHAQVWRTQDVIRDLQQGLEDNLVSLRFQDKRQDQHDKDYFVVDVPTKESVHLLTSKDWPSKIAIFGSEGELLVAHPLGTQEGLGVLGFCYAPYHFVYDVSYPVLFQIYDGNDLFQFPVVVVIDKNQPRQPASAQPLEQEGDIDICAFKTQDITLEVKDAELHSLEAEVGFSCLQQRCFLGTAYNGTFIGKAPSCLNGYLEVNAPGYLEKKQLFSSNKEDHADIILDQLYDVRLSVLVDETPAAGSSLISFSHHDRTVSAFLPETSILSLSEGLYNLSIQLYANSSLKIPASTKTQCQEVPRTGLFGLFGAVKQQCFDITLPETTIDHVLVGGGTSEVYLFPSDLEKGNLTLHVRGLPRPTSLEQLQYNLEIYSNQGVFVS